MKRFSYKAKEQGSGKVIKGTIQAESERAAGKLLMDRGYIPESLRDEAGGLGAKKKVKAKDRINFTRSFATLIGAGLPLAQSLRTVAEQTEEGPMKVVIEEIIVDIEAGRSLGDAFGKHDDVFNSVYLSLIHAGEVSGTLDNSLKRIAEQEEKAQKTQTQIMGAMAYPIIAFGVIILVFGYMMVQVVPQVEQLYDSLDQPLPGLTVALVAMKNFVIHFWYVVILGVVAISIILSRFFKTDAGVEFLANFKLKVPLLSPIFRVMYMARFTRTAQILLSTGVSVLDTLQISGEAVSNVVIERSILASAEGVKAGKPFSDSIRDKPYIAALVPQMAAIGEQSGKMDEMLGKAAKVFEDDLDAKIDNISTVIEPILMLALAGMAGVLVGGVLFPIYSLVQNI